MKKVLLPIMAVALIGAVTYFTLEGVYSVSRGTSLGNQTYAHLIGTEAEPNRPTDPSGRALTDAGEIEALLEKMKADGMGLGNTQYDELQTPKSSTRTVVDGCRMHKPNLRKAQVHLITRLFHPFKPIMAFWDSDRELHPDVDAFIERYQFGKRAVMTTNEFGNRVTLPSVEAEQKVIVAGDSVANGVLLNDDETIASQLQALDPERQYINTGMHGARAPDVICGIEAAVKNYGGQIDELVYVYFENDFRPGWKYGEPEEVVEWIKGFANQHDVAKVTVVYVPFMYNIIPQLTRFKGHTTYQRPHMHDEKMRLAKAVSDAELRFLDFTEIARGENQRQGTMFATFALFVDHAHLSPLGVKKLVEGLRKSPANGAAHNPGLSLGAQR